MVAVTTALIYPLSEIAPAISLGVVYLLGVLAVAVFGGFRAAIMTAIASALAFNWFHIPPTGRFTVAEGENWVALVVFLVAAVVAGSLAEAARARASEAELRRDEAEAAAELLRDAARERERLLAETVETEALRRSDDLKTALLRAVSHDLRSPLTAIMTAADALGSDRISDEDRRELAAGVVSESERLADLIDKLLDLSKLEAQEARPLTADTALDEVLRAAIEGVDAGALVKLSVESDLPLIQADPAQLERAFANLIQNAVRHSAGKEVSVRGRVVNGRMMVRVVNRGPGIEAALQERIFEPFYRAPTQNGDHRGSGLGLAIARGFIEANHGRVWAESLPGQGTTFVVELPL